MPLRAQLLQLQLRAVALPLGARLGLAGGAERVLGLALAVAGVELGADGGGLPLRLLHLLLEVLCLGRRCALLAL